MKVNETKLTGVLILEPNVFEDERGYFLETWNSSRYAGSGLPSRFEQDNLSFSRRGVLRGLHYQVGPRAQGKLVTVLAGEVFDVAVDLRPESPNFGEWVGVTLSAENMRQLYIPEGFGHGFVVTGSRALFAYKCTAAYSPEHERSLRWDDPRLKIDWPVVDPILSAKDSSAPALAQVDRAELQSMALARC